MFLSNLSDVTALISNGHEEIYASAEIALDCLLPTGIYISLPVDRSTTVKRVKELLWFEAASYPLHDSLKDAEDYGFMFINSFGEREEIKDEGRHISTIQPFLSVLKVFKRETRSKEKDVNSQISSLIGKHDFESIRDEEVIEFRRKSQKLCEKLNEEKASVRDLNQLIAFKHPPHICEEMEVWQRVCQILEPDSNRFMIEILYEQRNGNSGTHRLYMSVDRYPEDVIYDALQKQKQAQSQADFQYDIEEYVLKIVGREEYLLPDITNNPRPLYKYTYIYRKILKLEPPQLTILKKSDVIRPMARPRRGSSNAVPLPPRMRTPKPIPHANLWEIGQNFSFKVVSTAQVSCDDDTAVYLCAAIYHGNETICDMQKTGEGYVKDSSADFNKEKLQFNLAVCDLPRMSRLCFALYMKTSKVEKAAKRSTAKLPNSKDFVPMAWVNMCLFDFKARLSVGDVTLHMWPYDECTLFPDSPTNHLGTVISNPQTESSVALKLRFSHFRFPNKPIMYPALDKVLECAATEMYNDSEYGTLGSCGMSEEEAQQHLHELLDNRDPLEPFEEQDKARTWAMRMDISSHHRNCLPKLLSCVRWNSYQDVAQMQSLLQVWPMVNVDTALELLDCMYPDQNVRHFAVKCLRETISDTQLCSYLLQLVQALKFESYLECDLVYFLLERAIKNRNLGHYMFWLLKSEMHVPSVSVRFGLILEAYCRGSVDHVAILTKQDDTLSKFLAINRLVKNEEDRVKGRKSMQDILEGYKQSESMSITSTPLDPALRLSRLKVEACKYMDSKMRPLWLVWANGDKYGDDIKIMFKNGDDLRQDMLTLQVFHIMDNIWISQGLDLRMNAYDCLSTGRDVGMLEVVQRSETIANIQKKYCNFNIKSAFNKDSLYRWLQEKNPGDDPLQKAVHEFTLSCAGSCVSTYVLGVGDRHSDNIMLKETGQLFHIDFGHFLGNFKSKFGIKRERVPFVLTHDFIYIISKNTCAVGKPFDYFRKLCEDAFLCLRKKGNLLISLFMMMLSTGIPELRSVNDLKYLQHTLQLDKSDEEALKHFRLKFREAQLNSWKTSLNWALHNAARDNK